LPSLRAGKIHHAEPDRRSGPPTSGQIEIDGARLSGLSADDLTRIRSDKIGFVFLTFPLEGDADLQTHDRSSIALRIVQSAWLRNEPENPRSGEKFDTPRRLVTPWPALARKGGLHLDSRRGVRLLGKYHHNSYGFLALRTASKIGEDPYI